MDVKKPWQSKTNWAALVVAASAFIPSVGEFISKNPEGYALILSGIFGALRLISKGKISIE